MTRRSIVLLTGLVALIVFAGGAYIYDRYGSTSAQPVAAPQGDALVRAHSPVIGPADAPVTIVEFFDPSCDCLLYTSPSPRDATLSRMPSSA